MNINPSVAGVAGTSRAAARGGEADHQAAESTRNQSAAEKPAGKSSEAAVGAGDQTDDRGGNGRQMLDVFESSEETDETNESQSSEGERGRGTSEGAGGHLDLQA